MRLLNHYLGKVLAAAAHDPWLGRAFLRVAGLVDPPQALLAPGVTVRVLRARPRRSSWAPREAPDNGHRRTATSSVPTEPGRQRSLPPGAAVPTPDPPHQPSHDTRSESSP